MLSKLMSQMGPMKDAMDETKKKLDTITVKGDAEGEQVVVYVNGNRRVTEIKIAIHEITLSPIEKILLNFTSSFL